MVRHQEDTEKTFFKGKRPWSKIKDTILSDYIPPYLKKVATLNKPILLIDCFAGPGQFNSEGDAVPGSPLILCRAIESYAKGKCVAIFVNHRQDHHETLLSILGAYVKGGIAYPIKGDSQTLLESVRKVIRDHTLFVYLDPFGLKGCTFTGIEGLLKRGTAHSTEILVNLSMPTFHRFSANVEAGIKGRQSALIRKRHAILNEVFGGDYWREIAFDGLLTPEEKERRVMAQYRQKLSQLLPFTGSCPVREKHESHVKYFITFASRHRDAMFLMNDIMCKAYNQYLHEADSESSPLFASVDWRALRDTGPTLTRLVLHEVQNQGGRTRLDTWQCLVENHFMQFLKSEYIDVVQELVDKEVLTCPTTRRTRRLNDKCVLNLGKNPRI